MSVPYVWGLLKINLYVNDPTLLATSWSGLVQWRMLSLLPPPHETASPSLSRVCPHWPGPGGQQCPHPGQCEPHTGLLGNSIYKNIYNSKITSSYSWKSMSFRNWRKVRNSTMLQRLSTYAIVGDLGGHTGQLLDHPHLSEPLYPLVDPHNPGVDLSEVVRLIWALIRNLMHPVLHTLVYGSVCPFASVVPRITSSWSSIILSFSEGPRGWQF